MLSSVRNHLGDLHRVGSRSSSLRKVSVSPNDNGVPKWLGFRSASAECLLACIDQVEANFADKPSTLAYYRIQLGHLTSYPALARAKLNEIPAEAIASFIERQRQAKYEVSSINRALQVLRRAFHLAVEWGKVEKLPAKISLVPGERRRERVLSVDEESAYMKAAGDLA